MTKKVKFRQLNVGALVRIKLPRSAILRYSRAFKAYITEVVEGLEYGVQVKYKPVHRKATEFDSCHGSYVVEIIENGPYVSPPRPQNTFKSKLRELYGKKHGGVRIDYFIPLVAHALGAVDLPLATWPHEERATALYIKAGSPGKITALTPGEWTYGDIAVRWKVFKNWVGRNAQRLVCTKGEMVAEIKRQQAESDKRDREDLYEEDDVTPIGDTDPDQDQFYDVTFDPNYQDGAVDSFPEH